MRNRTAFASLLACVLASLLTTSIGRAQDPVQVAPDNYKVLFENDRVRVLEVTLPPGAKVAKHSHPDHMGYVLASGKIKISRSEGEPTEIEPKVGEVLWIPAETHWGENPGETEVRLLMVELKDPPAKKKAAKKAQAK